MATGTEAMVILIGDVVITATIMGVGITGIIATEQGNWFLV